MLKNLKLVLKIGLGVAFVVALGAYMITFRVEFNERAVLTTFGKASDDSEAIEPGLHLKWPYPFQSVTKYDTRIHVVPARSETQQTADGKLIIVEAFCFWRVSDPLEFFRRFSNSGERATQHFEAAEDILQSTLRSGLAEVGQYGMSDLFPSDGGNSQLGELEQKILAAVRQGAADAQDESGKVGLGSYGMEIVEVGIGRILLPQGTSEAVIARMRENRNRLVSEIESAGGSAAARIKTEAETIASTIESFADRRANEIKAQGDIEAAPFIAQLNSHPEFAIFLENMRTMSEIMPLKTTWVLPSSLAGLEFIDPSSLGIAQPGELPFPRMPQVQATGAVTDPNDAERDDG